MDWTGNENSVFKTLGASNHTNEERAQDDFYATDPRAVELLLELESFSNNIWEPASGAGHMSKVLKRAGYWVFSSDIVNRGYYDTLIDFLKIPNDAFWHGDIITNPPYKYAQEFVERAINIIDKEHKVAMFMKIQFLEGQKRGEFFKQYPPKTVWVSSSRLLCAKNGKFGKGEGFISSSAIAYAWFIWVKGYRGQTVIKWFN